jgi:hypothetical protein
MEVDKRDAYKLAYDEAVRGLAHQQSRLDDFRARAGIVLSAAAIATSLLGGQALQRGSTTLWAWVALACFIGVSALTLLLLLPRRWEFVALAAPMGIHRGAAPDHRYVCGSGRSAPAPDDPP